jgi:riboflavin synthase
MFTGLIEAVCPVRKLVRKGPAGILEVACGAMVSEIVLGESIAVSGCCLTVCEKTRESVFFDLSAETLSKSTFSHKSTPFAANIERALRADGRFGGHIVQGHVDGTGKVAAIQKQAEFSLWTFSAGKELLDEIVVKGSVAVDGISLTVASMDEKGFSVAVIPVTLAGTNLGSAKVGDVVNIETDIIGKMVKKQVAKMAGGGGVTKDKLEHYGF